MTVGSEIYFLATYLIIYLFYKNSLLNIRNFKNIDKTGVSKRSQVMEAPKMISINYSGTKT